MSAGPDALKALRRIRRRSSRSTSDRRPAGGRDLGLWLRSRKTTRDIPLVFAGGDASHVAEIRKLLPGAGFCAWADAAATIRRVRSVKKAAKAVAASVMAAYAGRPLAQKARHPAGRERRAGRGAERIRGAAGRSPGERKHPAGADSEERPVRGSGPDPPMVRPVAGGAGRRAWPPWPPGRRPAGCGFAGPSRARRSAADVTQNTCGKPGCRRGWWISKICAIDADWSGLCFVRRKTS